MIINTGTEWCKIIAVLLEKKFTKIIAKLILYRCKAIGGGCCNFYRVKICV